MNTGEAAWLIKGALTILTGSHGSFREPTAYVSDEARMAVVRAAAVLTAAAVNGLADILDTETETETDDAEDCADD